LERHSRERLCRGPTRHGCTHRCLSRPSTRMARRRWPGSSKQCRIRWRPPSTSSSWDIPRRTYAAFPRIQSWFMRKFGADTDSIAGLVGCRALTCWVTERQTTRRATSRLPYTEADGSDSWICRRALAHTRLCMEPDDKKCSAGAATPAKECALPPEFDLSSRRCSSTAEKCPCARTRGSPEKPRRDRAAVERRAALSACSPVTHRGMSLRTCAPAGGFSADDAGHRAALRGYSNDFKKSPTPSLATASFWQGVECPASKFPRDVDR